MFNKIKNINLYPAYISKLWGRYALPHYLRFLGISIGDRVQFYGFPLIGKLKGSIIEVGNDCVLCSRSQSTALGVNHPIVMKTLTREAKISIGANTGISGGSICAALSVEIGQKCLIGANVTIVDTDFHPLDPVLRNCLTSRDDFNSLPVVIEDNVFIGTGAIILKGVKIGKNSVVGAGSVVVKSVPKNSVVAGNPARVLKTL